MFVGETPVIAVDSTELEERERFTAAHELGHVLLAHHDTFHVDLDRSDGIPPEYNWRHERAANEFAASLLMPAPHLRNDVQHMVNANPASLAARYRVSVRAMSIRMSTLGLMPQAQRRQAPRAREPYSQTAATRLATRRADPVRPPDAYAGDR